MYLASNGSAWVSIPSSTNHTNNDYGLSRGWPRQLLVGGSCDQSNICGSSSMHCLFTPVTIADSMTSRGCSVRVLPWEEYF